MLREPMNYQPRFSMVTGAAVDLTGKLGWPAAREGGELRSRVPRLDGRDVAIKRAEAISGQPRRRVPECDIIYVGPRSSLHPASEPVDVRDLVFAARAAPPAGAPRTSPARNLTRPLVALLVLEIALASGIYFGKRYAPSHVIVVPPATSEHSVIT